MEYELQILEVLRAILVKLDSMDSKLFTVMTDVTLIQEDVSMLEDRTDTSPDE